MRAGNFSSSEIYKLIKAGRGKDAVFSAPGITYIQEKKYERKLGRSLSTATNAKPTSWGNLMELYVWNHQLGLNDYRFEHKKRYVHPEFENWTGCPDLTGDNRVADIKCPYTLKSFCEMVECKTGEELKEVKPEYYWQLVSNAILTESNTAELIIYVPMKDQLSDIRTFSENTDIFFQNGLDQNKFAWVNFAQDEDLPYLIESGEYEPMNILTFEVPAEDKELLIERVKLAVELLNK